VGREKRAVAPNTVENYLNLRRRAGSVAPRAHGGGKKPRIDSRQLEEVRQLTHEMPDATLTELARASADRCHVEVSPPTMARTLQRALRDAKKIPCDRA